MYVKVSFAFSLSLCLSLFFRFVLSQRYFRFVCVSLFLFCFTYYTLIIHIYLTGQRKYKNVVWGGERFLERGLLFWGEEDFIDFIRVHNYLVFKRVCVCFFFTFV